MFAPRVSRFLLVLCALLVSPGCSTPRIEKASFVPPTVQPAKARVREVQTGIKESTAQAVRVGTAIEQAKETVSRFPGTPGLEPLVTELRFRLDQASEENRELQARLENASGAAESAARELADLDGKLEKQIVALNEYADRSNRLQQQNSQLTEDRDSWKAKVYTWRWRATALAAVLGAYVLWTFRGPILFAARKAVGIPI